MKRLRQWLWLVPVASIFLATPAGAYQFTPSETEWAVWPGYCKARYITTNIGGRSQYVGAVRKSEVETWRRQIGEETFLNVHHYCAATASRVRAMTATDPHTRTKHLRYALDNARYSFVRTPTSSPLYAKMAINLALIETALGDPDTAIGHARQAIEAQPQNGEPYCALAQLYFDMKKIQEAREVLIEGDKAVEGKSREIHYNLGLIELELGNVESAVAHAKEAYAQGYPLPGLKRKLERMGAWSN